MPAKQSPSYEEQIAEIKRQMRHLPIEQQNQILAELGEPPISSGQEMLSGLAREAAQGLTFGFSDEIAAGLQAAYQTATEGRPFTEAYSKNVEREREALRRFQQENPGLALGANILGSLPTAFIPGVAAARGATIGRNILNAAKAGAVAGALTGVGTAEGGLAERLTNGAISGVTGGTLAGAIGGAIPLTGKATRFAAQKIANVAPAKTARAIEQATKGEVTAPGRSSAMKEVVEALREDRMTAEQFQRSYERLRRTGKPVMLADAARENLRGLVDAAMTVPNPARGEAMERLIKRAESASDRVIKDLMKNISPGDARKTAADLAVQQAELARPLYDAAYQAGSEGFTDSRLLKLLNLPHFKGAYNRAKLLAQLEGVPLPRIRTENKKVVEIPDLRTLDYIKRGLDDYLFVGKVSGSIGREERRLVLQRRKEFLDIVDELVPEYRMAREAFAGFERLKELVAEGREFWKQNPRDIQDYVQTLTPSEKKHYLMGAIDELRTRIEEAPDSADVYKRVFGSKEKRRLLLTLIGDRKTYREFAAKMRAERKMRSTNDLVRGGSVTAKRLANQEALATEPLTAVATSIAINNPVPAIRSLTSRGLRKMRKQNAAEIVQSLLSTDEATVARTLEDLRKAERALEQRRTPGLLQTPTAPPDLLRYPAPLGITSGLLMRD